MRTNSDNSSIYEERGWKRSDPTPPHIYDIHKSLVEKEVIIRTEIVNCSKQFISKLEPDIPNPDKSKKDKEMPLCQSLSYLCQSTGTVCRKTNESLPSGATG